MSKYGIVICDSGVDSNYLGDVVTLDIGFGKWDEHGHGNQLIGVIKSFSNCKITSIKILDSKKETTLDRLLLALERCLDLESKVVCLPLALENITDNEDLELIVDKLVKQGKVIISALANRKTHSLPAILKNVIGVKSKEKLWSNKFYDKDKMIQCEIPIEPLVVKAVGNNWDVASGNSLACALFSAHYIELVNKKSLYECNYLDDFFQRQKVTDLIYYKQLIFDKTICSIGDMIEDVSEILAFTQNYFGSKNNEIFENCCDKSSLVNFINAIISKIIDVRETDLIPLDAFKNVENLLRYQNMKKTIKES